MGESMENDKNCPIYPPLNPSMQEIRILVLETFEKDEAGRPICHLQKVSLDSVLRNYEAISWCWGDPDEKREILLNGCVIKVPKNAEQFIQRLCVDHGHEYIWLDAVCINQEDNFERASQVAMMDRIYSQAMGVLIWLGEDEVLHNSTTAQAAIQSINMLVAQCRESTNNLRDLETIFWGEGKSGSKNKEFKQSAFAMASYSNEPLPACDWNAIKHFFSSPFFSRLWTVQEVVLNENATCFYGGTVVSWADVSLAAKWMIYRRYWKLGAFQGEFRGINNASWVWNLMHRPHDLQDLLYMSLRYQTSLAHDKVYGLLGLLRTMEGSSSSIANHGLQPDYSADVNDVFLAATRAAIEQKRSCPEQFSMVLAAQALVPPLGQEQSDDDKRPSWVVRYDWKFDQTKGSPAGFPMLGQGAANGLPGCIRHISKEVLSVKGIIVGQVTEKGDSMDVALLMSHSKFAAGLLHWREMSRSRNFSDQEFAVTLTSSVNHTRGDAPQDPMFLTDYQNCVSACERLRNQTGPPCLGLETERYLQAIWKGSANKRFFTIGKGYIGTGPPKMEVGDVVCAVFGCRRPLVLRKEGVARWKLVGSAYVRGIMNGELIQQLQAKDRFEVETQWFDIH